MPAGPAPATFAHMQSPAHPAHTVRTRVRVLDLLRLLAAFQMVQGHSIDAVLALDARHGALHAAWVWLRGLTSVAFLFATGVAFHLVALREGDERVRAPHARGRRLRRAGLLVLLGYALHAPFAALWGAPAAGLVREALIVDVLQCIGASLALLELLALAVPSTAVLRAACALLAALCLLAAPWSALLDASGPARGLINYVSAAGGSLFPLLPWAGHVFLGVLLAPWLLRAERRAGRWLVAGLAVLALAQLAGAAGAAVAGVQLTRVGWVLVAGAALEQLEPATRGWPDWAWRLSSETLFIYAFHVLLVYGQGLGLAALIGERLSPLASVLLAAVVVALSAAAALAYRRALPTLAARPAPG